MSTYYLPTYYGGFDPGSGRAGLLLHSADHVDLQDNLAVIDSIIANGDASELLARGDIDAGLRDVIRPGEALVTLDNIDYFLEDLIKEGKNASYQLANPARYWSEHSIVLLLALAARLIPERSFVLRLVTALPVTLYGKENRQKVKDGLSGRYRFSYNGRDREAFVSIGYVAMEGQGALIHAGLPEGEQAVIDLGERTTDIVTADGQKLIVTQCRGNEDLGVGLITDALIKLYKRHGRVLSIPKAHELMAIWAACDVLPDVPLSDGSLSDYEVGHTIEKARVQLAKGIISFASSVWNVEGESVGQRFSRITVAGGGAYYVGDLLAAKLPHVRTPKDPEHSNIRGYADLALTLESKLANAWVA